MSATWKYLDANNAIMAQANGYSWAQKEEYLLWVICPYAMWYLIKNHVFDGPYQSPLSKKNNGSGYNICTPQLVWVGQNVI